ncbi:hypothetical protein ES705_34874 [subsurface metagenome]
MIFKITKNKIPGRMVRTIGTEGEYRSPKRKLTSCGAIAYKIIAAPKTTRIETRRVEQTCLVTSF